VFSQGRRKLTSHCTELSKPIRQSSPGYLRNDTEELELTHINTDRLGYMKMHADGEVDEQLHVGDGRSRHAPENRNGFADVGDHHRVAHHGDI
jgi:hypothetical protein